MNGAIRSFVIEERRPIGSSWSIWWIQCWAGSFRFDWCESFDSLDLIANAQTNLSTILQGVNQYMLCQPIGSLAWGNSSKRFGKSHGLLWILLYHNRYRIDFENFRCLTFGSSSSSLIGTFDFQALLTTDQSPWKTPLRFVASTPKPSGILLTKDLPRQATCC